VATSNLSTMHRAVAERLGPRSALRFKRDGLYHDVSWKEYRTQADRAATGLIGLGIKKGDRVGILAENSAEWLIADIAILATGAVDVPVHAPCVASQVEYQLQHSGARAVVVSNQDQADKVLSVLDALPDLEFLVSFSSVETRGKLALVPWESLKHAGWQQGTTGAAELASRECTLTRDDLATIVYTSGTTGKPKGVMLTHGNLLSNAEATLASSVVTPDDVLLSWLPYSHIYARTVDHYVSILSGATVCLAETPDTLLVNLAETQPTWMTAVPRFYEKLWAKVEHLPSEARAATLKRIFGPRMRRLSSGGAPLPRYVAEGFVEAGLPLFQGYGLTESSPVISFNTPERNKVGTVGTAISGISIAIAEDGEVLTRGPHVMRGYWKDQKATRAAIVDGWLHTGDVGHLDSDGFLTITDRKKDLIVTSEGNNVSPGELERLLTRDEMIDQAVVHGDGERFVTAIIVPNFDGLRAALGSSHGPLDTQGDLILDADAYAILKPRVDRLMQSVSRPERVRDFLILSRPFQIESGELTPTMKVRRRYILAKFRRQLDVLYASGELARSRGFQGGDTIGFPGSVGSTLKN
jgi:long-chain acyl-CoA synthetase